MARRRILVALALLAAGAHARAQESFSFSWVVLDEPGLGPSNSNGVVEPGEDARIYLHVSFRPGVGGPAVWNTNGGAGQGGTVAGLAYLVFDLLGTQNLGTGSWVNVGFASGFNLSGVPVIQPSNDLTGAYLGQFLVPGSAPNPRNDDWFFRARWRPTDYTPRSVGLRLALRPVAPSPAVLLDAGERDPENNIIYRPDTWSYNEPAGSFVVVPGPATALTVFAPAFIPRRRRR